jgi:hypothetical protein
MIHYGSGDNIYGDKIVNYDNSVIINGYNTGVIYTGNENATNQTRTNKTKNNTKYLKQINKLK